MTIAKAQLAVLILTGIAIAGPSAAATLKVGSAKGEGQRTIVHRPAPPQPSPTPAPTQAVMMAAASLPTAQLLARRQAIQRQLEHWVAAQRVVVVLVPGADHQRVEPDDLRHPAGVASDDRQIQLQQPNPTPDQSLALYPPALMHISG